MTSSRPIPSASQTWALLRGRVASVFVIFVLAGGLVVSPVFTGVAEARTDCERTDFVCLQRFGYDADHTGSWAEIWYRYEDYGYHNCTRFAAFYLDTVLGMERPATGSFGHAKNWGLTDAEGGDPARVSLKELGYPVNSTPAIGAIAWWTKGTYGHVGVVIHVEPDGTVQVASDNYRAPKGTADIKTHGPKDGSYPQGFIHIANPPVVSRPYKLGNFDGAGGDDLMLRRGNEFFLNIWDWGKKTDDSWKWGRGTDEVYVGDFDGDGGDDILLRRGNQFFADYGADGKRDRAFTWGLKTDQAVSVR